MKLFILLLVVPVTDSVKYSLTCSVTMSPGLQTFPEFVAISVLNGVQVGKCDSLTLTSEFKQDWAKKLIEEDSEHLEWHNEACVHILQVLSRCERDDETGEMDGFMQYAYDGENFVRLDRKNQRWLFSEHAAIYEHKWDPDNTRLHSDNNLIENVMMHWLKEYLTYGKRLLLRKDLPSVSLLQTSPSSPVSCHATGFYPDRATMLWRKDGEELHEDVDHGEMLPNHDGTFQMRVDLKLSSVKPEDWTRYDCVFQLSGVKDDIITKLDKDRIRTNNENSWGLIIGIIAGVVLVTVAGLIGFIIYRNKNAKRPPSPVSSTDVMEQLNPKN